MTCSYAPQGPEHLSAKEARDGSIVSAKVRALRQFTGQGLMDCKKALVTCRGDVLMAVGHLHYSGCLINLKSGDMVTWVRNRAAGYAEQLEWVKGEIRRKVDHGAGSAVIDLVPLDAVLVSQECDVDYNI